MNGLYSFFKKLLTPITILLIPHENFRSLNLKIPFIAILLTLLLSVAGAVSLFSLALNGLAYQAMAEKADDYARQFAQWSSTVSALKEVEEDFRKLFSLPSKETILETADTSYSGSVDIQNLVRELQQRVETVDEIRDYLRIQKDLYLATPKGDPVPGRITSPYGKRENPVSKNLSFHSGIDISASPGTPIRATADGIVSFSGWTAHSGYVVVVEHGFGFSSVYAHNKKNTVRAGQMITRGEVIGLVGSTGNSTGPHVHYEIWEKGKSVNPKRFLERRS